MLNRVSALMSSSQGMYSKADRLKFGQVCIQVPRRLVRCLTTIRIQLLKHVINIWTSTRAPRNRYTSARAKAMARKLFLTKAETLRQPERMVRSTIMQKLHSPDCMVVNG